MNKEAVVIVGDEYEEVAEEAKPATPPGPKMGDGQRRAMTRLFTRMQWALNTYGPQKEPENPSRQVRRRAAFKANKQARKAASREYDKLYVVGVRTNATNEGRVSA